jgi:hypothetical protein
MPWWLAVVLLLIAVGLLAWRSSTRAKLRARNRR